MAQARWTRIQHDLRQHGNLRIDTVGACHTSLYNLVRIHAACYKTRTVDPLRLPISAVAIENYSLVEHRHIQGIRARCHLACSTGQPKGCLAQLGERSTEDAEVPGSIPGAATLFVRFATIAVPWHACYSSAFTWPHN